MSYLFYRLFYDLRGNSIGKREASVLKSFLLLGCGPGHMDWVWEVSVLQSRPGSSLKLFRSCVNKLWKENTEFLFKMDWLNVLKDFFSKLFLFIKSIVFFVSDFELEFVFPFMN